MRMFSPDSSGSSEQHVCIVAGGRMTVPCEGQLLLLTPPFDDLVPEPIVLGTMQFCPGLMDEHGKQVSPAASYLLITVQKSRTM